MFTRLWEHGEALEETLKEGGRNQVEYTDIFKKKLEDCVI
jgi:hypothetical protein